jgi:hypothetical protein
MTNTHCVQPWLSPALLRASRHARWLQRVQLYYWHVLSGLGTCCPNFTVQVVFEANICAEEAQKQQ